MLTRDLADLRGGDTAAGDDLGRISSGRVRNVTLENRELHVFLKNRMKIEIQEASVTFKQHWKRYPKLTSLNDLKPRYNST